MIDFLLAHLDYPAMALLLLGYFRMSAFKVDAWLWSCAGSLLLVIFGIPNAMGVSIGNAVFMVITVIGFFKWRKTFKNQKN